MNRDRSAPSTTTSRSATGTGESADVAPPGYRLPAATTLGRIRLEVADLERSVDFYGEVLGLRPLDRARNAVVLAPRHGDNALIELRERPGARPVPRHGRLGLYHFAVLLPERAALGRFLAHLGALGIRAGMSDHLVSEAIYLSDPDGLGIEVYADRPRASWRYEGGQLQMTTEPLDVRSVLDAAGPERWAGAPAGTVMGHVHLHVGDLTAGAAFYHEALGFDKTVWAYPGALFLSAGGYHHHLGTNTWAAGAQAAVPGDARLVDWEIIVPHGDLEAAADNLTRYDRSLERVQAGIVARDPWGTAVRLVGAG